MKNFLLDTSKYCVSTLSCKWLQACHIWSPGANKAKPLIQLLDWKRAAILDPDFFHQIHILSLIISTIPLKIPHSILTIPNKKSAKDQFLINASQFAQSIRQRRLD